MVNVLVDGISTAGGIINGSGPRITVLSIPVVRLGDSVQAHGDSPHRNAHMVEGTPRVTIAGMSVCFEGHVASCGHLGAAGVPRITLAV